MIRIQSNKINETDYHSNKTWLYTETDNIHLYYTGILRHAQ